ncbi:MAG: amidohydrolase family protein [Chloroflexota bacterium]
MTLDVLIRGGWVVDGTGNPPYPADVAIAGDRIVEVGRLPEAQADRVIDATGRIVTPGFIDAHSHSDWVLLANPTAESAIRQGVTTEIVGNCGIGQAPTTDASRPATTEFLRSYGYPGDVTWGSFAEYLDVVRATGTSINYGFLVGHNSIRTAAGITGPESDEPQRRRMERMVAESVEAGALGMSTGLEFDPGRSAPREEIRRLAAAMRPYLGMYASHVRNRSSEIVDATEEFMSYVEAAGGRGQFSHLNVRRNTGAADDAWAWTVERIARARREGLDVLTDTISMTHGLGGMTAILPPWILADGNEVAAERLADPEVRRRLRTECDRYWRFIHRGEWHRVRLMASPEHPELDTLTFPEIAARRGTDVWDAYFDLLMDAGPQMDRLLMYGELYSEQHLADMVSHPLFMLAVDAVNSTTEPGPLADRTKQPLVYAGQLTYLTKFVRETGLLRLEEAVRKMTSMPATHFGLRGRGLLAPGYVADVVVLDLVRLRTPATFVAPAVYAEGVDHVLVGGTAVLDDGRHTGARPGRPLLRS